MQSPHFILIYLSLISHPQATDTDPVESCTRTYIADGLKSARANEWRPCLSIDCSVYGATDYEGHAGWTSEEAARTNCYNWGDCVGYWSQTNGWYWAMDSNAWSARETAADSAGAFRKDCTLGICNDNVPIDGSSEWMICFHRNTYKCDNDESCCCDTDYEPDDSGDCVTCSYPDTSSTVRPSSHPTKFPMTTPSTNPANFPMTASSTDPTSFPMTAPSDCSRANEDKYYSPSEICCDGLKVCREPRWPHHSSYCSPDDKMHNILCWSTIEMCREDECPYSDCSEPGLCYNLDLECECAKIHDVSSCNSRNFWGNSNSQSKCNGTWCTVSEQVKDLVLNYTNACKDEKKTLEEDDTQRQRSIFEKILDCHPSGVLLAIASLEILSFLIFMSFYIILENHLDSFEKIQELIVWFRGSVASFDFYSDISFILYASTTVYSYLLLTVLVVSFLKSLISVHIRDKKLTREALVRKWESVSDFRPLAASLLFLFNNPSPVYYDLLLTNSFGFPIHPANRSFIYTEKLLHVVLKSVPSICIVAAYVLNERSDDLIPILSLTSSVLMSIFMMFGLDFKPLFSRAEKYTSYASVILTVRKDDCNGKPSKRKMKKEIENLLGQGVKYIVNIWYFWESSIDYQFYICIENCNKNIKKEEIRASIKRAVDMLELPTRNSIQVDIHEQSVVAIQMISLSVSDVLYESIDYVGGEYLPTIDYVDDLDVEYYKHYPKRISETAEGVYELLSKSQRRSVCNLIADFGRLDSRNLLANEDCYLNLNKIVGKGNFGEIFGGSFRGAKCAFKKAEDLGVYASENILLKEMSNHPNICRYYGICRFEDEHFLVMEYFPDGSLLDVVKKKKFSNEEKLHFCLQLTQAIWHLHALHVLHGDLALRNVLVDVQKKPMGAVLTDFGQSCHHPCKSQCDTICPRWSSPELVRTRFLTFESDIWAMGITFWEIFTNGRMPYLHLKGSEVISRLSVGDLHPAIDEDWPIADILTKIFMIEKEQKYNARMLFDWIKDIS